MNTGRTYRYALVAIVASASLILTGCSSKDSGPSSSSSSPPAISSATPASTAPVASPPTTADPGMSVQGETAIGALGDPCALLTVAEVESGSGYKVTAVTRGAVTNGSDGPQQNCVYLTDGPSLVGPLASALGAMAGQDPQAVTDAVNAAGGLVGVTLMPTDTSKTDTPPSAGGDSTDPNVNVRMVSDLGTSAAVITLPSGAAAVAAKGSTTIMLMVLIDGTIDGNGVEQMLRAAYGKA